jgi:hypothetical protein
MSEVADVTLRVFSEFALAQHVIEEIASRGSGQDAALREALQSNRRDAHKLIRSWERKNQRLLHKLVRHGWFDLDSWHANVLAAKLNDDTRPVYFEYYCERELGDTGKHRAFGASYEEIRRLRNFLAHNYSLRADAEAERLRFGWYKGEPFGPWLEANEAGFDLAFMRRALEVAEWLADVAKWTSWRVSDGFYRENDKNGVEFSGDNEPASKPPQVLGLPAYSRE